MDVLPRRRRLMYLIIFIFVFIVAVPSLALYASGYRLSSSFSIIKTGGIHVAVPTARAQFFLDGEHKGGGTLFQKSFFVQNLTPGLYTVRIEKEGYHRWEKTLEVYPTVITDASALLLPRDVSLRVVPRVTELSASATTTGASAVLESINTRYSEIRGAFSATSTGVAAASLGATSTIVLGGATTTVREENDIGLWKDNDGLHAWWLGGEDEFPFVFCEARTCTREILISSAARPIGHFDFFPDDELFVMLEQPDGIVVTELDTRGSQNTQPIFLKDDVQFRVIEDQIYILDGDLLFEVEL